MLCLARMIRFLAMRSWIGTTFIVEWTKKSCACQYREGGGKRVLVREITPRKFYPPRTAAGVSQNEELTGNNLLFRRELVKRREKLEYVQPANGGRVGFALTPPLTCAVF
jgi:hypothetical protein